jgi:hypothetical protein
MGYEFFSKLQQKQPVKNQLMSKRIDCKRNYCSYLFLKRCDQVFLSWLFIFPTDFYRKASLLFGGRLPQGTELMKEITRLPGKSNNKSLKKNFFTIF